MPHYAVTGKPHFEMDSAPDDLPREVIHVVEAPQVESAFAEVPEGEYDELVAYELAETADREPVYHTPGENGYE